MAHLAAPVRAQRTPKGPPRHPWGTEGAAKTAPNKNSEPLDRKRRGQENYNKNTPQIRSPFCAPPLRGAASPFRGALFGDAAARRKHKNHNFTPVLDPKGCQNVRKPYILPGFVNTRLSRQGLSAQRSVVFRALVLHWPPARNRQTRPKTGLKVAVTLLWLLGPRGPPRGCPERPRSPQGNAKHDGQREFKKKILKTIFL